MTAHTPADLRVRREALGLSQTWLAERLGVQDRAVRRWEAGDRASIPADVWRLLDDGERRAEAILDAIADELPALEGEHGPADAVDVVVYPTDERLWAVHPWFEPWPASWHRAVCARVRDLTDAPVRYHYPPEGD